MRTSLRNAALALTLPGLMATSLPAAAATAWQPVSHAETVYDHDGDRWEHGREGYRDYRYGRGGYYGQYPTSQRYYDEPVYAQTPVWRGNDGRYYCRKKNGTTGLIIGGAAGALIGRSIAGRGDNTLGTILGGAAGALLGRSVERSNSRCR